MRAAAFPVYYGWPVLAASAISEMLAMGATAYAAGLFVLPLQAEFHISRANASSAILILYLGAAFVAPFIGKVLDRYSIRLVMLAGAIITGASFAAIASAPSLGIMAAVLVLPAAIGFMLIGPLTTSTMASRWFYRRRGLALGIAAVATSGGGFVVVPLLSEAIQRYGWRLALLYEGAALAVIVIVLAFAVLRDSPFAVGLGDHPENQGREQKKPRSSGPSIGWKTIFASRAFWIPSLVLATISGTSQATVVTLVPYGVQLGFSATAAALFISAFAVSAAVTKVSAGLLADRINQRFLLAAAALFMTLSWLILCLVAGYAALFASACLAGIALGCALPTAGALIAAHFGSASFGTVMGWTYAMTLVFAILSVRFIGYMFDKTGGYPAAFAIFCALLASLAVATFVFALGSRTPREIA